VTSDIVFWVLATMSIVTALAVVVFRNVFRAALALIACFFVVAGIYATLGADFLAVAQVLIYIGAISILIILAIMLTRDSWQASTHSRMRVPALIAVLLFGGTVIYSLANSTWNTITPGAPKPTTVTLGIQLFGDSGYVITLEIAAVMLLAAILGAVLLIREK